MESMFFGTVKGSYTGASNIPGLFEQAENGTIFRDEINSMDMGHQAKILKVIENGKLRRDLYCRLSSCILHIPPLRERKSDIPLYCSYFLKRFNKEYGQHICQLDENLLARFMRYDWPGNVRELQHVIESAYSVAESSIEMLRLEHISPYYRSLFEDMEQEMAQFPLYPSLPKSRNRRGIPWELMG